MKSILVATRGGKDSYPTQDKAISLAKENGAVIIYLYVVDLDFLSHTAAPIVVDVESELAELGEFMLLVAKERAAGRGVRTINILRHGKLRDELIKVAESEAVSLIILGRPTGDQSAFREKELREFADDLQAITGVETRIL